MGWYIFGFPFTSHALLTEGNLILWKYLEISSMFENTLKSLLFAQFEGLEFYGPSIPRWLTPYRLFNINFQS